jgi:hypothetical protein
VHRYTDKGEEWSATPLIQAALNGHADAVRVLMSRGANANLAMDTQLFMHQYNRIACL